MAEGVTEQRDASFNRRRHTGTAAPLLAPPKLFLADNTGVSGDSPVPPVGPVTMSPTSTLQAVTAGSPTSPAATAAPFSRHGASSSSSSSSGGDNHHRRRSHRPAWEWEAARPAGLGLAGALNGDAPPAAAVLRGRQSFRSPAVAADDSSSSSSTRGRRWRLMSPWEMMEASEEEDYTRVIDRGGKNTRTTHIFDGGRVVVDGCGGGFSAGAAGGEFLRWCHGCSKDLAQGKDIFMYRGEMAFCSHECRYREMLLLDEES